VRKGDFSRIDNRFVISRQAVQNKVLSPLVGELDENITKIWNEKKNKAEIIGIAEILMRQ
jgi:hypothetical protein